MTEDASEAVDRVARDSYGRLIAFLAARTRDIAAAEDALSDAFAAALRTWPSQGIPNRPEAWLLTAARRRLIDGLRHGRVHEQSIPAMLVAAKEADEIASGPADFIDERLKLLFICAHPAIDAAIHTPLMLQTVLRLDAARIASAFCVSPAAMARRLTRAKTKISRAGIPFELPDQRDLPSRLGPVLEAIYAAYGSGWEDATGTDGRRRELPDEALHLGRLVATLLPGEPETHGLLALMLHCEARRRARRDASGNYVPLTKQDVTLWSAPMIYEAERQLAVAASFERPGRFQLEAAIQSAHASRLATGRTDWETVALLYEGLVREAPTIGAMVGRAAAATEARGPESGWELLQRVSAESREGYQPYWALAADLLARLGRDEEARDAYANAIGLSEDPAIRAFLMERAAVL